VEERILQPNSGKRAVQQHRCLEVDHEGWKHCMLEDRSITKFEKTLSQNTRLVQQQKKEQLLGQ
jgi:hypothetical protein